MDTEKYHKNNKKSIFRILSLFIIPLGIFSLFLLLRSKDLVFAYQYPSVSDAQVKGAFYLPDSNQERFSYGPKLVMIKRGESVTSILTTLTDIHEILRENGITLIENDSVYLNTQYVINGSVITIVNTKNVVYEVLEEIPYTSETIESSKYLRGQENIIQEGKEGVKKLIYTNTYQDGILVGSELIDEVILKHPIKDIREVGTSWYSLEGIQVRGYDCEHWYSVVDSGPYSDAEKSWLKFIMYCESGCNAESNKGNYKGLFQWSPYWWSKQFSENIFDGYAQIKHTVEKYRAGESTRASQWPACNAKYLGGN